MQAKEILTDSEDINLILLHSSPESWKHTVTTLKQTVSLVVHDLDYVVTKIESLAMDEQSRNLVTKKDIDQYVFKGEKSSNHAFVSKESEETQEDDHLKGDCFFVSSPESATLGDFIRDSKGKTPKVQTKTLSVEKAQDVMSILLKCTEHKYVYTSFNASFQAYLGNQLTPMELMVQALNDINHDDVEEMDIQ